MPIANLPAVQLNYLQLPCRHEPEQPREDVVMIHGLAANLAFWYMGAGPAFTRIGRVTMYDLRGHGYSAMPEAGYSPAMMTDDLRVLLDSLGIQRPHVVAHSFGGTVALNFALAHPERVKSLILADVRVRCAQPELYLRHWPMWSQMQKRLQRMGITLDENDPEAGLQFITELARQQISNPERAEQLQQVFMRTRSRLVGSRQAKRWLKLLETTSAYGEVTRDPLISIDDLARLAPPVLAIFGEYSMSIASGETLARHCADCTFEIVPKAGHFFPLTRPQVFAQRSLHFLARFTDNAQLQAKVQRRERAVVRRRAFRRLRQGPAEPPQ